MQQKTLGQRVRDFFQSTPMTILLVVLAGYLFSIGWIGTAIVLVLFVLWEIAERIYYRRTPDRPPGYDFSLAHNRIFSAAFCCLVIFQTYGLQYSWIPIILLILWEIGWRFFLRPRKEHPQP